MLTSISGPASGAVLRIAPSPRIAIEPESDGLAVVIHSSAGRATVWRGSDPLAARSAAIRWVSPSMGGANG